MSLKPKKRLTVSEETGSVLFNRVGDVEFWMTAINRIFLMMPDGKIVFPTLQGAVLRYDEPHFKTTAEVEVKLRQVLQKQREVRMNHWHDPEEEAIAWQWS